MAEHTESPGKVLYVTPVLETDTYISASFTRNAQEDFVRQIRKSYPKAKLQWFDSNFVSDQTKAGLTESRKMIIDYHRKQPQTAIRVIL